jgi:hypothetical protein
MAELKYLNRRFVYLCDYGPDAEVSAQLHPGCRITFDGLIEARLTACQASLTPASESLKGRCFAGYLQGSGRTIQVVLLPEFTARCVSAAKKALLRWAGDDYDLIWPEEWKPEGEREPTRCRFCSPRRRAPEPCPHFVGSWEDWQPRGLGIIPSDPRIERLPDGLYTLHELFTQLVEELGGHSVLVIFDGGGMMNTLASRSFYVPDREAFARRLDEELATAADGASGPSPSEP